MQFVGSYAGQSFRLSFTDRAAIDRAQKIIQESLPRGGIVEHVTDKRGFRGLLDKILQPRGCGIQPFEKK